MRKIVMGSREQAQLRKRRSASSTPRKSELRVDFFTEPNWSFHRETRLIFRTASKWEFLGQQIQGPADTRNIRGNFRNCQLPPRPLPNTPFDTLPNNFTKLSPSNTCHVTKVLGQTFTKLSPSQYFSATSSIFWTKESAKSSRFSPKVR